MEYLKQQVCKMQKPKVILSSIFEECANDIQKMCNNLDQEIKLKDFWISEVCKLKEECRGVKIIEDIHMIDFGEFELKRHMHFRKRKTLGSVADQYADEIDELFNPVHDKQTIIPLSNIVNLEKLGNQKRSLVHEPESSKNDLLYYSIVDLDTKYKQHSSNIIFSKEERKQWVAAYKSNHHKQKPITLASASILEKSPNSFSQAEAPSFKALLKLKKADARKQDPSKQKVLTKRLIKMMKTFCENADEFKNYNETEYTFYFLVPILKQLFKDMPYIHLKLGESHLNCSKVQTNDESRAAVGSKIDIIISHKIFGVEIGVVEVSGPSHKVDKTHFLGDRAKIAKNLKSIHKQLERSATTPNLAALKRLKLYGIQVYLNKIIIYSLTRVSSSYWVFLCEQRIDIPSTSALFQNQLPAFFGYLWSLNENLKEVDCHFKEFLKQSNEEHILSSDSEIASPEVSPRKKQKAKA